MTGDSEQILRLRVTLPIGQSVNAVAWSPDGKFLAAADDSGAVRIWSAETLELLDVLQAPDAPRRREGSFAEGAVDVAWSPDGSRLAAATVFGGVVVWDAPHWKVRDAFFVSDEVSSVSWSPDSALLSIGAIDATWITTTTGEIVSSMSGGGFTEDVLWTDRGLLIATYYGEIFVANDGRVQLSHFEMASSDRITCIAQSTVRSLLAVGLHDGVGWIPVHDLETGRRVAQLEGHTNCVSAVAFSPDGRLLASKSYDQTLILWDTETWTPLVRIKEPTKKQQYAGVSFHPTKPLLASLNKQDLGVRIWDIADVSATLPAMTETLHIVTVKLVLVGESNAGKSCLALRLAEDRYEEQGTTHGAKVRRLDPASLGPGHQPPPRISGELVLWDLGGQDEYRLVHQLFLQDTHVALFVFDPTRGDAAFDDVRQWLKSLERHLHPDRTTKVLVGSKIDEPNDLVNRTRIDRLVDDGGFACYVETSAKNSAGITELWQAIAAAVRWEDLGISSRPALFQDVEDEIRQVRDRGEVVLAYDDLLEAMRRRHGKDFNPDYVESVVHALAAQGVVVDSVTTDEDRVLVLDIAAVERYAGSLIVAASQQPVGVPALELAAVTRQEFPLPGLADRLPRLTERVVLECVVELLIKNDLCLNHEGMLIFPTLFAATTDEFAGAESAVSLYYDFAGAIDNIYSSLVVGLAISGRFGRVRLSNDGAAFERSDQGTCGIRKLDRSSGFAHIDVYFDDDVERETRDLFINFIDDHLRQQGVQIHERLEMRCACGYEFSEEDVRRRIAKAAPDIGCPQCDRRNVLSEGAQAAREKRPEIAKQTWALRTDVESRRVDLVTSTRSRLAEVGEDEDAGRSTVRILHLSDLHISADADVPTLLGPLLADLRSDDLADDPIDYLVVSGDITNRATAREFEVAYEFMSNLIAELRLSSARCVLVPGNHDLSWDEEVYTWRPKRHVDPTLSADALSRQGTGYLVRDEARYPQRFSNFSKYLYHPLMQRAYPVDATAQCVPALAPGGVQFLAFNSSWQIDEQFPSRSGINLGALARGLAAADEQVQRAVQNGQLNRDAPLRIAVWHHPVTGNEKMPDTAFLTQLKQAGVRLCLHGHVHEARPDLLHHLDPEHAIHIVGAGTFDAVAKDRPESTPRMYNVVTVDRDAATIRVDTRAKDKPGGAWEGWAKWPAKPKGVKQTFYKISLR